MHVYKGRIGFYHDFHSVNVSTCSEVQTMKASAPRCHATDSLFILSVFKYNAQRNFVDLCPLTYETICYMSIAYPSQTDPTQHHLPCLDLASSLFLQTTILTPPPSSYTYHSRRPQNLRNSCNKSPMCTVTEKTFSCEHTTRLVQRCFACSADQNPYQCPNMVVRTHQSGERCRACDKTWRAWLLSFLRDREYARV